MIIYECDPHYSSREEGDCVICGAKLKARELSKYTKTRRRWLSDLR